MPCAQRVRSGHEARPKSGARRRNRDEIATKSPETRGFGAMPPSVSEKRGDGDGRDDLATWQADQFRFDLAANGFGQQDATINFGFMAQGPFHAI